MICWLFFVYRRDLDGHSVSLITDTNLLIRIVENPPEADESAVGAINRPLLLCQTWFDTCNISIEEIYVNVEQSFCDTRA